MPSDRAPELDAALSGTLGELFQRFEATLPANTGAVLLVYTRDREAIDITGLVSGDAPGEYLRVLDAAHAFAVQRARVGAVQAYIPPTLHGEDLRPTLEVSRVEVSQLAGGGEVAKVWNRGNLAGELVVQQGDGLMIAAAFGLLRDDDPLVDEPTVEWHEILGYRVSFDVRPDASRFIIVRGGGGESDKPELVAQGLIDTSGTDGKPNAHFDSQPPAPLEITAVAFEMCRHWAAMRERLRARGPSRATAAP